MQCGRGLEAAVHPPLCGDAMLSFPYSGSILGSCADHASSKHWMTALDSSSPQDFVVFFIFLQICHFLGKFSFSKVNHIFLEWFIQYFFNMWLMEK